jgi:hypothetical protein
MMASPKNKQETYFRITYKEPKEGKLVSLKARTIRDSSLGLTFVSISDFIFDTASVVVNPAEEAMSKQYELVKNLHLSIYSIVSIEEVGMDHEGLKFDKDRSNLVVLSRSDA